MLSFRVAPNRLRDHLFMVACACAALYHAVSGAVLLVLGLVVAIGGHVLAVQWTGRTERRGGIEAGRRRASAA